MTLADELLQNAIDLHCHCYPEFSLDAHKRMEDLDWINLAAQMGMKGAVLKSHFWPTMANVYYLQREIPSGFQLFSSITLNVSCGGVATWAVEAAASLGAKVIWMPTWSSANDQKAKSMSRTVKKYVPSFEHYEFEGLRIIDSKGGLIEEARKILQVAKERELVLCTGHLSAAEGIELAREAKRICFPRLIFSHPDNPSVKAEVAQMKEAGSLGAYVEFCFLGTLPLIQRKHPRDMVALIREVGADRCVLTTDSFYDWVPPQPEIMRMGIATLLELGISAEEMKMMVQINPASLLGLNL
jgi:hypothetical protein